MITINKDDLRLKLYLYENSPELYVKVRPLILVIPGGGYRFVSDREADPIAYQFLAMGYNTAILNYACAPLAEYPEQYLEGFAAIKYIKDNAEELGVDPDRIVVCGFSAGGHLAGMLGTGTKDKMVLEHFGVDGEFFRLAGMILGYPVINGGEYAHRGSFDNLLGDRKNDEEMLEKMSIDNRVDENTCPAFIWHTFADHSVPVFNSLMMAEAMKKHEIPFEMHIFPEGGHGLSLANDITRDARGGGVHEYDSTWVEMCGRWLRLVLNKER